MKVFSNRKIIQKMAIILLILTLFNFTIPKASNASSIKKTLSKIKDSVGDMINVAVNTLILTLGDSALNIGQHFILGMEIDSTAVELTPEGIFSNSIPFIRADFIKIGKSNSSSNSSDTSTQLPTTQEKIDYINKYITKYTELNRDSFIGDKDVDDFETEQELIDEQAKNRNKFIDFCNEHNDKLEEMITEVAKIRVSYGSDGGMTDIAVLKKSERDKVKSIYAAVDGGGSGTNNVYKKKDFTDDDWRVITYAIERQGDNENMLETIGKKSIGEELRGIISKWYYILRNIALIAMLSVLVYIGIRIVISSVAQEKSKYKNMLMDWLIGICLLFTLHLIMVFITGIIGNITTGIAELANLNNSNDTTNLVLEARTIAYSQNSIGYAILYCALIAITYVYLIYYIKRALNLAFLTLIAPLIALTYPIDKITDGKAQAFDMWLKDYIFFTLIQPVHLLLYIVFVTSSIELAKNNILYALVALWFIKGAEGMVRKLFGFDSKAPGVGGPGGLAALGMTAHAMKDISKVLKGDKSNSGNGKGAEGKESSGSDGDVIREKDGPNGLSGFEDNKEDNDTNTQDANTDGEEYDDIYTPDANIDVNGEGRNDTDISGSNIDGDSEEYDDIYTPDANIDVNDEGRDDTNTSNSNTDDDGEDKPSEFELSDNKTDSNSIKSKKLKRIAKGAYKGLKFTGKAAVWTSKRAVKASGVGIGALTGAIYGIANGEGVINGIAQGATVGAEVADIGTSAVSNTVSSTVSGVTSVTSAIHGKIDKNYELKKQYADFVKNKQNIKKFKETYGKDYRTKMEEARQYVNAGYTNFDDIKKGFKIQNRNGFNQEQAINIMDLDKKIGNTILNEKESKKYRDKINETVGKKDGKRIISALEDIQTGFLGDGPASK